MRKGILVLIILFAASTVFAASFTDNLDGTVTDSVTGLMWQKGDDGITKNWQTALSYCEVLLLAGHSDWRLPDIKELESIVDDSIFSPAIDTNFFPSAYSSFYWSATTFANITPYAWDVNFYDGNVYGYLKSYNYYARCVR